MVSYAVQKGGSVYVYNEKNEFLFCKIGELCGYTPVSISVKNASCVYVYSDKGTLIGTHMA